MDEQWGSNSTQTSVPDHARWFADEKYSLFIHWGLNSVLGGEWKGNTHYGIGEWIMHEKMADISVEDYRALAKDFNPTSFDASSYAKVAKASGVRCVIFTAKHHEGFAMFDSKASEFSIAQASPLGRDIFGELAEACHKEGLRVGFYYSHYKDWIEPDGGSSRCNQPEGFEPDFDRYFDGKVIPQVTELLSNYGFISVVWFDTPGGMEEKYSKRLMQLIHEIQPECLVNSRVGNGYGHYSTLGDMELPTKTQDKGLYECIDTTNNSWAYAKHDSVWKSPSTIAHNLIRTISRGVSFMINIGPDGEGCIPSPAVESLTRVGNWISLNEEAVYGTQASPFLPFDWGDCTVKGNRLYLHVFDWPKSGQLRLPGLQKNILSAEVLGKGTKISYVQEGNCITFDIPFQAPDPMISVIKLSLDGDPKAQSQDLSLDGAYSTNLLSEYAKLSGPVLKIVRWMETFGEWKKAEVLEQWFENDNSQATWSLQVLKAGRYTVEVEYACEPRAMGSEWELCLGRYVVRFCSLPSGKQEGDCRMRFLNISCGVLDIDQPGPHEIVLRPRANSSKGDIMVRQVTLRPWE